MIYLAAWSRNYSLLDVASKLHSVSNFVSLHSIPWPFSSPVELRQNVRQLLHEIHSSSHSVSYVWRVTYSFHGKNPGDDRKNVVTRANEWTWIKLTLAINTIWNYTSTVASFVRFNFMKILISSDWSEFSVFRLPFCFFFYLSCLGNLFILSDLFTAIKLQLFIKFFARDRSSELD